ncbi:transglycosylase-like protein with SLT domain [Hasllibacter halocynthiae]|uniref:Transglycosylase-like protein with SLT domain n=1 Tax=Hasllibacter halocynthiae TaxID=595589 RepID=A0A2T0X8Z1_9RHOB|nr:lytic transglycosylase domain-containing protein [Hasllibacter halocynthiae]PRY95387.1 transglycosylase-like protein with SLT domain [Hasllibacter halocynthiae]
MRALFLLLFLAALPALADPPGAQGWPDRVCAAIDRAAAAAGIDPHFHARLLWQESRFRAGAVSPAGAQGIAQFMPGTAAREGLADPFDPWSAIEASARHLADLEAEFGNPGLAAAGYNAGAQRVRAFLAGDRGLPRETRNYLGIVTGLSGAGWRDGADPPDMALGTGPFRDECARMARAASSGAFRMTPATVPVPAFGVVLAAGRTEAIAARLGAARARAHDLPEGSLRVSRARLAGMGTMARPLAILDAPDRDAARTICRRIAAEGGWCRVYAR